MLNIKKTKEKGDTSMFKILKEKASFYNSIHNSNGYDQFYKKIWVLKDWDGGSLYQSFSFFLTEIKDENIEGKFSLNSIAEPDFYSKSFKISNSSGNFFGRIGNNLAKCYLSDNTGIIGSLDLILKEKNEIESVICKYKSEANRRGIILEGNYIFRPYNLSDIKFFTKFKKHSFPVSLNSWGNVNFVAGELKVGKGVKPAAFLTNNQDEIFYYFNCDFEFNSNIVDVSIRDINNDGLKDLIITTAYKNQQFSHLRWIILQKDNGLFYDTSRDSCI